MKRLQNRIAEGPMALPAAAAMAAVVWLLAGLVGQQLWLQLACFAASVYLLVELSNQNALLRVRSRMVTATFIVLSCTASFLFPVLPAAIAQLCFIAAFIMLFQTYQDPQAAGRTFYAFAALGLGSMAFVHTLAYVPLLWVLMATQLQSLSLRTWTASLIGLAAPYWVAALWLVWQQDFSPLTHHFAQLGSGLGAAPPLPPLAVAVYVFTLLLALPAIAHFWHHSYEDKIRIRLLYGFFTTLTVVTMAVIPLLPALYPVLMRLAFVFASPLIAHAITFTSSRLSGILFFAVLAAAGALIVLGLVV